MVEKFKILIRLHLRALKIAFAAVIVAALMSFMVVLLGGSAIQTELIDNVSTVLRDQGFKRIDVHSNGRDIVLRGKVSGDSAESAAMAYALAVKGVRIVRSDLEFIPLRLPHVLVIRGLDKVLSIEGELSSAESAKQLIALIVAKIEHSGVKQRIEISPEVSDSPWISVLPAIMDEANQLEGLEIEIGAGRAIIGGLIRDKSGYRVVIQRLSQFLENEKIELVNRIGIVPTRSYAETGAVLSAEDVTAKTPKTDKESPLVEKIKNPETTVIELIEGHTQEEEVFANDEPEADVMEVEETLSEIAQFKTSAQDPEQMPMVDNGVVVENPLETDQKLLNKDQCQLRLNEIMSRYPVNFSPNRVDLPPENIITIKKIVQTYDLCPALMLTVEGHTDSSGKLEINLRLSQLRAERVVESLISAGFPKSRVKAIGFGASNPVADNRSEAGRRKNRRIELRTN